MAPADDDGPEPVRSWPGFNAFGSTSLLMAAIVLVSAVASFGAVRVLYPKARTAPAVPAAASPSTDMSARVARGFELPRAIETPKAGGRLSIVTDPAGARVEIDG